VTSDSLRVDPRCGMTMVAHICPRVRGCGVNQTKAALYIYNGYIPFRTAVGKFITAALAIGAGHSLGPEDPSLQIGASLASALGRRMDLSRSKLRLLAPGGAAAGLAAAFNASVSAVLFVIEEVIGRRSAGELGSVVLSAISSVVVVCWFLGSEPLFRIPAVTLVSPAGLLVVLGLIGGFASVIFCQVDRIFSSSSASATARDAIFSAGACGIAYRTDRISGGSAGDGCKLRIY
jgi:CIC family chloride channel protein